jgi:hypothetical protein
MFFCGKGDNSNLNIDISKIQLAINWITDKYASKTPQPNERRFKKIGQSEQELLVVAMFVNGSEQHKQSQQRTFHRCFLPSFGTFGQTVSEKNFLNQPIRNKNRLWNMVTIGDSCFWLANFKNSSLLLPFGQMNRNLVGSIYGRSFVKLAHSRFLEIDQSETRIACGCHVC